MIKCKPSKLECNKIYLMQIISAETKQSPYAISKEYYTFRFWIRVWQDDKKLANFNDMLANYHNSGNRVEELIEFVECATGYEVDGTEKDIECLVGAVFRGIIGLKITYDQYGPDKSYYLEVKKHLGYCDIEGGERR